MSKPLKGDDIGERLLDFAVRIIKPGNGLPKSTIGRHACLQILRAGTSAGANYEEARGAESSADFAHELGVSLKELRETRYWLQVIARAGLIPASRLEQIIQEADELWHILGKSIATVKRKSK